MTGLSNQEKQCTTCGKLLPLSEFHSTGKRAAQCKVCRENRRKQWAEANKEEIRKKRQLYYRENKDRIRPLQIDYQKRTAQSRSESAKVRHEKNKEAQNARNRERHRMRKRQVLEHYGGSPPSCACCGESIYEFLSIDHIEGGGSQHRKVTGSDTYRVLLAEGLPAGYRVLCMNCNTARGYHGYCPHELQRKSA